MNKLIIAAVITGLAGLSGTANAKVDDDFDRWIQNPVSVFGSPAAMENRANAEKRVMENPTDDDSAMESNTINDTLRRIFGDRDPGRN